MDFRIVWTEPAVADLEGAVRYVAAENPAGAESLRDQLLASVAVLGRLPYLGPVHERDRTGRAREIACRSYRIFYRVREGERRVEVLRVWHGSRREPRFPRG